MLYRLFAKNINFNKVVYFFVSKNRAFLEKNKNIIQKKKQSKNNEINLNNHKGDYKNKLLSIKNL